MILFRCPGRPELVSDNCALLDHFGPAGGCSYCGSVSAPHFLELLRETMAGKRNLVPARAYAWAVLNAADDAPQARFFAWHMPALSDPIAGELVELWQEATIASAERLRAKALRQGLAA